MTALGRVAVVHEWVAARAGSEKVFEEIGRCYPDADLYAMTLTPGVQLNTGGRKIHTTPLDRLGSVRDRRGLLLPFMPVAWRYTAARLNYDTVISSSHACAKGFRPGRDARHFCYVHAPMRYVWDPEIDARGASRLAAPARAALRRWDRRSTRWVNSFAANSSEVADRVRRYYERDATVIFPPVDTAFFTAAPDTHRDGLVSVGRLIPYKGHDLAIRVAARLDVPIRVVGRGPDEARLRALAADVGAHTTFVVNASDVELRSSVASAEVLVFAAVEDFGIVPVEAQAAGTPVVGPALGGLRDTVINDETGVLSPTLDVVDLAEACAAAMNRKFDPANARRNAERFGVQRFRDEVSNWVAQGGDTEG